MDKHQKILLAINLLGGVAVLASYAQGLGPSGVGNALWGNVPQGLRPLYTVSMLTATVGYFCFSAYLFRVTSSDLLFRGRFSFNLIHGLYAAILVASALWLPLTALFIQEPSAALWWAIRFVLLVTGAASLALVAALVVSDADASKARLVAIVGAIAFSFQTALLDAVVWPYFFR